MPPAVLHRLRCRASTFLLFGITGSNPLKAGTPGFRNILGAAFHALEPHNKARGQFFTPYATCRVMALTLVGSKEEIGGTIVRRGFLIAHEPAVSSGAMIVALADALRDAGFNYQRSLHVTAVDIDRRGAHMGYIQISLPHIPATLLVGDSLAMRFHEEWHTPGHVMGSWNAKLRRAEQKGKDAALRLRPQRPDVIVRNRQNQSYRHLMLKGLISSGFSTCTLVRRRLCQAFARWISILPLACPGLLSKRHGTGARGAPAPNPSERPARP